MPPAPGRQVPALPGNILHWPQLFQPALWFEPFQHYVLCVEWGARLSALQCSGILPPEGRWLVTSVPSWSGVVWILFSFVFSGFEGTLWLLEIENVILVLTIIGTITWQMQ